MKCVASLRISVDFSLSCVYIAVANVDPSIFFSYRANNYGYRIWCTNCSFSHLPNIRLDWCFQLVTINAGETHSDSYYLHLITPIIFGCFISLEDCHLTIGTLYFRPQQVNLTVVVMKALQSSIEPIFMASCRDNTSRYALKIMFVSFLVGSLQIYFIRHPVIAQSIATTN